jgi:hypothetical protein
MKPCFPTEGRLFIALLVPWTSTRVAIDQGDSYLLTLEGEKEAVGESEGDSRKRCK